MPIPYAGRSMGFFKRFMEAGRRAYRDLRYGYDFEISNGGKATYTYENGNRSGSPGATSVDQTNEVSALGLLKSKLQDDPNMTFTLTEDIAGLGKKGDTVAAAAALRTTGVKGHIEGGLDAFMSRYYENLGSGASDFEHRTSWMMKDLGKTAAVAAAGIVGFKATQLGVSLITGD